MRGLNKTNLKEMENEFNNISSDFGEAFHFPKCKKLWKDQQKNIKRRFDVFKSEKLFIVATGMLKAGKSTLVNLLARSTDASPIGFGVDTTLRPALIMASQGKEKVGIYCFFPKVSNRINGVEGGENDQLPVSDLKTTEESNKHNQLENIIDRISGLKDWDEECPRAPLYELNQDNLLEFLCKPATGGKLPKEPLLVVVVVPDDPNSLLTTQNCAIFDMPGLDSANAKIDFETYTKIFQECSLLLFVQSNVAPLNEVASKYLESIGSKLDKNSYRLLQNRMDTRLWRKSDLIKSELEGQLLKGKKDFTSKLMTVGIDSDSLAFDTANLGMAYDALFHPENIDEKSIYFKKDASSEEVGATQEQKNTGSLLEQSGYKQFESNLCDDIKENGEDKHNWQCVKQLDNALLAAIKGIEDTKKMLGEIIEKGNNMKDSIIKSKNEISAYDKKYNEHSFAVGEFSLSADLIRRIRECVNEVFMNMENESSYTKIFENQQSNKKIDINKYNVFLKNFDMSAHEKILKLLNNAYFDDIEFKVLTGAGEEERKRSVLELMNAKIDEMKEKNSEICNPIECFSFKSETLRDFLPTELDRILKYANQQRTHSNPKWWSKNKDMINKKTSIVDRDDVRKHYEDEVKNVFNKIIKGMMAKKLNAHCKDRLHNKWAEKDKKEGNSNFPHGKT